MSIRNMHIRVTITTGLAPRFSLYVTDALTGDGQEKAFRDLCPRRDNLTEDEVRSEIARLQGLGHFVSGDRASITRFNLPRASQRTS